MPLLTNDGEDGTKPSTSAKLYQGEDGAEKDAYSVLATFRGSFAAKGSDGPEASGGVAQYFATGLAARV